MLWWPHGDRPRWRHHARFVGTPRQWIPKGTDCTRCDVYKDGVVRARAVRSHSLGASANEARPLDRGVWREVLARVEHVSHLWDHPSGPEVRDKQVFINPREVAAEGCSLRVDYRGDHLDRNAREGLLKYC